MKASSFILESIVIFIIAFITASAIAFVYNYLIHGNIIFESVVSFRLAIIFAIIIPLFNFFKMKFK